MTKNNNAVLDVDLLRNLDKSHLAVRPALVGPDYRQWSYKDVFADFHVADDLG